MNTINKIINYFKESYQKSKLAFYCEVFETILLVTGSAILSFTILDPATKIFQSPAKNVILDTGFEFARFHCVLQCFS